MKLLYVINKSTDGGLVVTTRNRMEAFRKRGIDAQVLFFSSGSGAELFKHLPHYYVNSIEEFQKIIKSGNFDYIIFVYSLENRQYVPDSYNGKIIYELRGWSGSLVKSIKKSRNKAVDGIVCIAKYIVPYVRRYFPKDIPIFVDGNTVSPHFHYIESSVRGTVFIPNPKQNHAIIAFVGRVEGQKNWREFINICKSLEQKLPIEAWFISNPKTSSIKKLHKVCQEYKLNYKVIHVSNNVMPEIYSTVSDSGGCVLSTSVREGLGNSILEPMACQCPVVSSNQPGKNEVIKNGFNGLLYKLGNIEEGADCVERIITDIRLRNRIIQNALLEIQNSYNDDAYAATYLKILSEIKKLS